MTNEVQEEETIQVHCTRRPDPLLSASILSRLLFTWAYPLLKLGAQRPLEEIDLNDLNNLETSAFNRKKIEDMWQKEKMTKRKNLGRALFWDYLQSTRWAQVLLVINMTARIVQALALGLLMEQFGRFDSADDSEGKDAVSSRSMQGYLYAGLLVVCGLIAFLSKQQQFFETYRKGIQLRVGMVAAIYSKTLRLPSVGIDGVNSSAGRVTNLASNDVERFLRTSVTATFLILAPFCVSIILLVGIYVIGPVFAVGYGLLFLLVPLQLYLGRKFAGFRSKIAAITDDRVSLISQAVSGVRVMKYNGWERNFNERVSNIRSKEVANLLRASRFKALNEALFYFTSLAVSVFIFTVHVLMGGELTPKNVFTTMTLMSIVQFILTKHAPAAVAGLSECYISCKRIQAFFELPDRAELHQKVHPSDERINEGFVSDVESPRDVISLSGVTCHWKGSGDADRDDPSFAESAKVALSEISLTFKTKQLYCIIGKVASGKSALLHALAGELPVSKGEISRNYNSLSYAVQDPWIMNGSVRENIVMGLAFDQEWYAAVVEACGLVPDISGFLHGDLTVVGDRGIQCSGGQRARLGLARAVYCDSEVLLLDDPLR